MAGTDDNILGGQDAVIRVGVEADMSEILQQANKFNELIKDANDSFNVMQTVITSTATRMASLNSATLRLVSSARQLRNEYQLIAENSQRISLSGVGDVGAGVTGIGGGSLAGVTAPSGVAYVQGSGGLLVPETMAVGGGAIEIGPQTPGVSQGISNATRAGGRVASKAADVLGTVLNANEPQYTVMRDEKTGQILRDARGNPLERQMTTGEQFASLIRRGASPGTIALTALGKLPGVSGLISSLPSALVAGAPYALAGLGAAVAAYKAADYMVKGSTKYTGLTGGTGVFDSPAEGTMYGFNRGSFIGLQAQKWLSGLSNMAVGPGGYGEIQEGLLTAGYKPYGDEQADRMGMQGMRYDRTRGTLASLYAKGFQDVGANIALMQTSIESARTSTAAFTSSMDMLRVTAQKTNASMKGLTTAFTTAMKALSTGMGASGNWSTLFSTSYATAFANSRNAALRNGGAIADISKFGAQVQLINTSAFRNAGITFENRFMAYANSPGMAETLALGTDQAADQLLRYIGIGNVSGRDPREVEMLIRSRSNEVEALRNSPMVQSLVGPEVTGDINAFIEWLASNATGNPISENLDTLKDQSGANYIKNFTTSRNYFASVLGDQQSLSRGRVGDFLRASGDDREKYSVLSNYYDYVGRNQKSIGWLDSIIRSDEQDQTWVNYRGQTMKLGRFMETYSNSPEARKLMESGNLQIATSQDGKQPNALDFAAAYNTGAGEKTVQNATLTELGDQFKSAMSGWAKDNNAAGNNKLKVSVDGAFGIG